MQIGERKTVKLIGIPTTQIKRLSVFTLLHGISDMYGTVLFLSLCTLFSLCDVSICVSYSRSRHFNQTLCASLGSNAFRVTWSFLDGHPERHSDGHLW